MINGITARMDYENGVRIMQGAFGPGINVTDSFGITQSDLRLEQPFLANTNTYTFPVLTNQTTNGSQAFNTELRLNPQDTFLPQYVGIFVALPSSTTDTTFKLLTYINPFVFTNAAQMQGLYNGQLKMAVNNKNYITNWMTKRHELIPQTQATAAPGAASPVDQLDGGDYSMYPMQPYIVISGSANTQVQIILPAAPTTVDANARIVVVFRGLIAYNSTVTT